MSTVAATRTVVIVGSRPLSTAAELLADVDPEDEAVILVLGLDPTTEQRRLSAEALALATERRFALTAEAVSSPDTLQRRLQPLDEVRVAARPQEARRYRLSAPGAR